MRVLVLALAAAALAGCGPMGGGGGASSRYVTEKVTVGDVEKTVLSTGALQPSEVVNVGAQASGQIQSLKVQLGDRVKAGQLIAVIDPSIQENTLRNTQATLAVQQAQRASQEASLAQNQLSLKRAGQLLHAGISNQAAFDQADTAVKVSLAGLKASDAQIRQAQLAVERAQVDLSRTNIVAPIDGVVAVISVRQGQTVNSIQVTPTIVRLAIMDVMTVKAEVSEADVINVHPGQKVYFTILGDSDHRYYGTLRTVEPAPDSAANDPNGGLGGGPSTAAVYYNALFDVPNPEGRLRAAMTAQVNIVLAEAKGVLKIPASALRKKGGGYVVLVLGADGKSSERAVHVGLNNSVVAQITDGLKAGETVVISDSRALPGSSSSSGGASVSVGTK